MTPSGDPPDPIDLRPRLPLRERLFKLVSVPLLLGAGVFGIAVIVAVLMVALRPPIPEDLLANPGPASAETSASSTAESARPETTPAAPTAAASVQVHVVGAVRAPGVVELPAGSRVAAAIERAGGATPEAVLSGVNLARPVVDGEQIVVPDAAALASAPNGASPLAPQVPGDGIVHVNSADAAALESLPGVGPALAGRILDWRASNGPFTSLEQLLEVAGIGEKTLEGFRDRVAL